MSAAESRDARSQYDARAGIMRAVGDPEKLHPWLFNIGVGLLFAIVGWYVFRNAWIVFVVPFIWAYMRVAWVRGRGTPSG
jgi:hypothetical protein